MKFDIKQTLKLDFLGDGWGECYLAFSPITIKQAKEFRTLDANDPDIADKGLEIVKELFIDGKGLADGKIVDITKKDLEDMPMIVINKSIEMMVGNMSEFEKKIPN